MEARGSDVADLESPRSPPVRALSVYEKFEGNNAVNPFSNLTIDLSNGTTAILVISGLVLFVPRLVTLLLGILLMAIFGNLATLGISTKQLEEEPLPCWRKVLRYPAEFGVRLLFFSMGVWWISEVGHKATAAEAPIVVANHSAFLDLMLIWARRSATVSAALNAKLPVLGPLARSFQFIFVDRKDKDSRSKTMDEIAKRAGDPRWPQTAIFPEGTTTNATAIIAFKKGPFVPGKPVQPIAIKYHWERWGVDPSFVVGKPGMGLLGLRLMCIPWLTVTMTYLPVLEPSHEEKADPSLFARRAQEAMAESLGVPTTMHSFDDVQLAIAAYKQNLPVSAGSVEFKAIKGALNDIDVKTAKGYLERFAALEGSKTNGGLISKDEFSSLMQKEAQAGSGSGFKSGEIDRLFFLLDDDQSGALDFRKFLVIMAFVNGDGVDNRREALRLAFRVFDDQDTGAISTAVLADILHRGLPSADLSELTALANGADADSDGQVTYEDFFAFAEANAGQLSAFKSSFFGAIEEEAPNGS